MDNNIIHTMYENILPSQLHIDPISRYLQNNVSGRLKGEAQKKILNEEIVNKNTYLSVG